MAGDIGGIGEVDWEFGNFQLINYLGEGVFI